ncbi:neutral zinc metallopeptidase [Streptosporangium soli]|nr:neutral zinc metallopeptidase [Streptosporangium sp. KLBMP 9127]
MPPRRQAGSAAALAFGSVGALALTLTAVVVAASLSGGDDAVTPASPDSGPTATRPSGAPGSGEPGSGEPGDGEPAEVTPPSPVPPDRIKFGQGGGSARIELAGAESMLVDLRYMSRGDTRARLTRNPLYGTGVMRPISCRAPRPSFRPSDMNRFLRAATSCLDRAWAGKFAQARARFLQPRRIFYTGRGRGPCGSYPSPGASAYYCPASMGMYIGLRDVVQSSSGQNPAANPVIYLRVLAHEYGHHVQYMAGISGARSWEVSTKSRTAQDAYTRRSELQAQCLAGIFARSTRRSLGITSGLWRQTVQDQFGRGDDTRGGRNDHGTGAHYAAWLNHGYRYGRVPYCNTWAASASDVR